MSPKKKRILYTLFFVALLLLVPVIYLGVKYSSQLRSNADTVIPAKNIQIFNVTANSFDIAWVTDAPTTGKVQYGTTSGTATIDATDIRGASYNGTTHLINVRNLEPEKTYFYKVVSGKAYTSNTESIQTTKVVITEPVPVFGTAGAENADKIIRAYLLEKGSGQKASTIIGTVTSSNGSWSLDAGNFRKTDGNRFESLSNYLIQLEGLDKDGNIIARTVTADIGVKTALKLTSGSLDDPIKIASTYTGATTRNDATPTPAPTSTTSTSPTPSPSTNITTTPTVKPQTGIVVSNIDIVNISEGSFTLIWETDKPTNSYVTYTINGATPSKAFDKRSSEDIGRSLRTHFVEITDTTNPEGTKYEITLVNNEVPWSAKQTFTKFRQKEVPRIDATTVSFNQTGNFIDQILIAEVPNKSTKIATVPGFNGKTVLDLSDLRSKSNISNSYDPASTDVFAFTLFGGVLENAATLQSLTASQIRSQTLALTTSPKDTTPFVISYINIKDGATIKTATPSFSGEGFSPDSDLIIEIQKQ
jgi:hypothetical protein